VVHNIFILFSNSLILSTHPFHHNIKLTFCVRGNMEYGCGPLFIPIENIPVPTGQGPTHQ